MGVGAGAVPFSQNDDAEGTEALVPPVAFGRWPAKPCWNQNSVSKMPVLTEIASL